MKLTTIREIYKNREVYLDKEVTVGGWVRSVRDSKTFGFIVLHDGSYFETLQIVYHDEMENFAEISKMNVGAAIIVKGTLYGNFCRLNLKRLFCLRSSDKRSFHNNRSSDVQFRNFRKVLHLIMIYNLK